MEPELPELPPLPDTHIVLLSDLQSGTEPGFNAHQMRSYALQCYRKGVEDGKERAARVAESDEFYGSALQHHIAAAIRGTNTD